MSIFYEIEFAKYILPYRYALFTIITCLDFPNPFTLTTDYTANQLVKPLFF